MAIYWKEEGDSLGQIMKNRLKKIWKWFIHLFLDEFEITVYRQSEGGHMYRSNYNAKRILIKKPNHIKFRDWETKKIVEVRGANLDYKIEEK